MGFDIECIIDIHTYPGEYFCPVCRTLVYPNEALQSQCTHLYCKPCLAHVANNTRTCPYDGYLVTEGDSKPLLESDKALAENIGKVKVRCLYHRSGCTWGGPLSECTSHCSGCTFGNSPVICNRCGIQIVHRQVHDHARSCPGVHQVQQAADATQNATSSGPIVAATGVSQDQATILSGAPSSQVQNSQTASGPIPPGQDSNQQTNASAQAPAAVPATPIPEQWYQNQYQQYYQQYAGYGHYQQAYQLYYPYQQSAVQQIQQQPVAHGGQPQLQVYSQAPVQAQMQPQPQSQSQFQPVPHSQSQPQQFIQSQAQSVQTQTGQPQVQLGQSQPITHVQAVQTQNQPQVTPQHQVHHAMQSHGQPQSQSSLSHGFPAPQSQAHLMQPQPQHVQGPQYQQHLQPSQVQLQPHLPPQAQLQSQPHSQLQQPPHLQHHTPHPQMRPLQPNQPTAHAQPLHSTGNAVTGHQSYPQAQPLQEAQLGVPQQHPDHAHETSGSFAHGQLQGQIPQQPAPLVPLSAHGQIPTQLASFPSQVQVPSMPPAQQQQFHPRAPQQNHLIQQRPVVHSAQQTVPQQYPQQQPIPGPLPGQLHQQGHLATQQSQLRPQGPPPMMHPNPQTHLHVQQNVPMLPGTQSQLTHNYADRPVIPIHGTPGQPMPSFPQAFGGFASLPQPRPAQLGSNQPSLTQNYVHTVNNQLHTPSDMQFAQSGVPQRQGDHVSVKTPVGQEACLPSLNAGQKIGNTLGPDSDGFKALKSEVGMGYEKEQNDRTRQKESLSMGAGNGPHIGKDLSGGNTNELRRAKEESTAYSLEPPANGKLVIPVNQKDKNGDYHDELESHNSQKAGNESLQANHAVSPPSGSKADGLKNVNPEGSQQTSTSARDQLQLYSHEQHMHHYGPSTNHPKSVHPPAQVRPHGPGLLPHTRNPMNPSDQLQQPLMKQPPDAGGVPPPGPTPSFEGGLVYFNAPRGPPSTAVDRRDGIIGGAHQHGSEGQFGPPHFVNPADIIQSQKLSRFDGEQPELPGSFGRGPFGPSLNGELSSFRMDGGPGFDSSIRSQDEKFKTLPAYNLKPFSTPWSLDQGAGSRALDRQPHGSNYESGLKLGFVSGGPPPRVLPPFHPPGDSRFSDAGDRGNLELDRTHQNLTGPGRDYHGLPSYESSGARHGRDDIDGRDVRSFVEGSRSYNMPSEPVGNSFHENRFPPLPSFQWRGELDGREHGPPGPHNNSRRGDLFGQDTPPSHFRRGELAPGNSPGHLRLGGPTTFGPFPGQSRVGELPGPGYLPHNARFGDSLGNKTSFPRLGEPGFRSSFSQGFPNDGPYRGGMDPFDNSRKRMPISMGWCRICKVDCETVEGLDIHSQSRGHQKMALDMVMSIKQQNKKKSRLSSDRAVRGGTNKRRNTGVEGRGNKP